MKIVESVMNSKKIFRIVWMGLVIWLIPFVMAFGFYDRSGQLTVSYDLFKSLMIVISSIVGCFAIVRYFKDIQKDFMKEGWIIGVAWLLINWLLDVCILVPMAKMSLEEYVTAIGTRYLQIPVICAAVGMLLQFKFKKLTT
jgi:hypothetical protein